MVVTDFLTSAGPAGGGLGEFGEGYRDGRDPGCPEPGPNRSHRYRHSFEVGRRERAGCHWPAHEARRRAYLAECLDGVA